MKPSHQPSLDAQTKPILNADDCLALHINALETAERLWKESRMKIGPAAIQSPPLQAPKDPTQAAAHQGASKLPDEPN